MKTDRYQEMTVAELRSLARERGIRRYSRMRKAQLVEELIARHQSVKKGGPEEAKLKTRQSVSQQALEQSGKAAGEPRRNEPEQLPRSHTTITTPVVPEVQELPACYGQDRLAVIPRDSRWVFVYWELTEASYARARRLVGNGRLVLRLWLRNGSETPRMMEFPVPKGGSRYFAEVGGEHTFVVAELGMVGPGGEYCSMARSRETQMPRSRVVGGTPTFVTVPFDIPLAELREKGRLTGSINISNDGRFLTEAEYRERFGVVAPVSSAQDR